MKLYLYGFSSTGEAVDFGSIGFDLPEGRKANVVAIPAPAGLVREDVAAVVGPSPLQSFCHLNRSVLLKLLVSHQHTLETIMVSRPLLPCKFGALIDSDDEATMILTQNADLLCGCLKDIGDSVQFDLVARWDPRATLNEIMSQDPELTAGQRRSHFLRPDEQEFGKAALRLSPSARLRDMADLTARSLLSKLAAVSDKYVDHDLAADGTILNASFLLSRGRVHTFFSAIEEIDRGYQGRLSFRCVGPLPAYSFAMIEINRFDSERIRLAHDVLGLKEPSDTFLLKRAYRQLVRETHPDFDPSSDSEEFRGIHQAYELLADYYENGSKAVRLQCKSALSSASIEAPA